MVLDDVLATGLRLVICGTAAGKASAAISAYYAGPGNGFWKVIHEVGLTPSVLVPADFRRLLEFKIGLTDLVKLTAGNDDELDAADFDVDGLRRRVSSAEPGILAFNGKKAASIFLGRPTSEIAYGKQRETIGNTTIWVLPSTSAAARGHWSREPWAALANDLGSRK